MPTAADIDLDYLIAAARDAGREILAVYQSDFEVEAKSDASPLTEADLRSHRLILGRLAERYPEIPVLSEESAEQAPYETRRQWRLYWLVDPLDGTKEFVKRNGQFTVNIALIEDGRPIAGVVHAPALDLLYWAGADGAFKSEQGGAPVRLKRRPSASSDRLVVIGSRSHPTPEMADYVEEQRSRYSEVDFLAVGSSLKLCMLAENKADVYPRFGPTMEWDTAAAHAVLRAAGGKVVSYETGQELPYNKADLHNGWFIAS